MQTSRPECTIMRLSLLPLLLLSASSPALAQADPDTRDEARTERPERPRMQRRSEAREAPPPRSSEPRPMRTVRDDAGPRDAAPPPFERRERRVERERPAPELSTRREPAPFERNAAEAPAARLDPMREIVRERAFGSNRPRPPVAGESPGNAADGVAARSWREREAGRRGRNRDIPPAAGSPVLGDAVQTPQTVTRPGRDVSIGSIAAEGVRNDRLRDRAQAERWRQDWRRDRRYDWRRYRDDDRARFHIGIYIDPFGWGYRDWDVGWRLPYRYYSSRYWINDPWRYRLPPVYGPYRWVRYHRDVLLIDLRDGRIVDRIRTFFW